MSKSRDTKKDTKKKPAQTPKEKKKNKQNKKQPHSAYKPGLPAHFFAGVGESEHVNIRRHPC